MSTTKAPQMHGPLLTPKIFVFDHKIAFMQRLLDYTRTGHHRYISGVTDAAKIFQTFDKLAATLPLFFDRLNAFRAREKGEPTARLLMYLDSYGEKVHWFVLLHPGDKKELPPGQNWADSHKPGGRIEFTGYQLIREAKEKAPGSKSPEKPTWTWKYSSSRFQDLRDSIIQAIRSNRDQDLKVLIEKLSGTAGFSGSRAQAKSIMRLIQGEWKLRRGSDTPPMMPNILGWARRKADKGVWLVRGKALPPPRKERPINKKWWRELDLNIPAASPAEPPGAFLQSNGLVIPVFLTHPPEVP